MDHQGILVVVSGFSGAGKGTLMKELLKRYDNYALSISATTRAPREGETDGKEYFFVSKEQFEKMREGIRRTENGRGKRCDLRDRDPGCVKSEKALPGCPVVICNPAKC